MKKPKTAKNEKTVKVISMLKMADKLNRLSSEAHAGRVAISRYAKKYPRAAILYRELKVLRDRLKEMSLASVFVAGAVGELKDAKKGKAS